MVATRLPELSGFQRRAVAKSFGRTCRDHCTGTRYDAEEDTKARLTMSSVSLWPSPTLRTGQYLLATQSVISELRSSSLS